MSLRTQFRNFMHTASFRADAGLGIVGSPSPDSDFYYGSGYGYRSHAGPMVNPASATKLSAVFACVRVVAETKGSLPIMVYRERKSGGHEPAKDHPAMELFATPNPWQTWMDFYETISIHEELRGNAYALKEPKNGRAIGQLTPLHPDRVRVYLMPDGRLRYEVTSYSTGKIDRYTQDEIVHFRGLFSYDGIMGVSFVAAMSEVIGVGLAQQEHRGSSFRNRAIPGMVVTGPKMNEDREAMFRSSLDEGFSGEHAFRAMLMPPGYDAKPMGLSNKDAQLIEASSATKVDICGGARVPPHKIGDLSRGTFSNIEQQNIEFATDGIRPRVVRDEQRFNRDVIDSVRAFESAPGDYYVRLDLDALYRGDMKSRYEAYAQAISAGWMVRNEARASDGRNPITGLDEPLQAVNVETIDQAERRNKANVAAANATADSKSASDDEDKDESNFDRSGGGAETPSDEEDDDAPPRNRSANTKARVRTLLYAGAGRIVRREAKEMRRLAEKYQGAETGAEGEINAFYLSMVPTVAETMAVSKGRARRYCAAHAARVVTSRDVLRSLEIDAIEDGADELVSLALS